MQKENIKDDVLVSIIVPVYNVEDYVEQCLLSLINQSLKNIEIICINDGSTDNSDIILKKYAKLDDRVIVIEQENRGVSEARNKGLSLARGKYIGFADPDDFVEETMYEKLVNKIDDSEMIICEFIVGRSGKKTKTNYLKNMYESKEKENRNLQILKEEYVNKEVNGFCWNKMYLRKIIEENNIIFDKDVAIKEDTLFNMKYIDKIDKVSILRERLYNYCIRSGDSAVFLCGKSMDMNKILYVYNKKMYYSNQWSIKEQNNELEKNFLNMLSRRMIFILKNESFSKDEKKKMIVDIVQDINTIRIINKMKSTRKMKIREKRAYCIAKNNSMINCKLLVLYDMGLRIYRKINNFSIG